MRRILSTLLLALLVVAAQQAALVHEISHGIGSGAGRALAVAAADTVATSIDKAAARVADSGTTEGGSYCDKCFQFAHVCGAGFCSSAVLAFLEPGSESARGRQVADLAADAPQSRSRGPPIVL